jgi:hypothetical protein
VAIDKISGLLGEVEKQIVKTAVEALLEKGLTIEAEELNVYIKNQEGKPLFKVTLTGKFTVKSLK